MSDEDPYAAFSRAIELWKNAGDISLDRQILELFHSGFFRRYAVFAEQLLVLLDHRTMKYLYVSETFSTITGHDVNRLYEEGLSYVAADFHPEDMSKFVTVTEILQEATGQLSREEILRCCSSYTYRIRFPIDQQYHHILQHNIPLTVDADKRTVHLLAILSDITAFKRDETCRYRVVLHNEEFKKTFLAEGVIGHAASESISAREKQILHLIAEGLTEKEIAERLYISAQTVKTHRKNLFRKTGVRNSIELIRYSTANLII